MQMDLLERSSNMIPHVLNGTYTYTGNQMSFQSQMDNFYSIDQQNIMQTGGNSIYQANITIVGSKVK
jgi:hypothetical protein